MGRKYKIIDASNPCDEALKVGQIVYELLMHDYGLARDDTVAFGKPHISVTHDVNGGYPSFTIPFANLELID
jgi:hypothetical protein